MCPTRQVPGTATESAICRGDLVAGARIIAAAQSRTITAVGSREARDRVRR
jgi:hypothetical protein